MTTLLALVGMPGSGKSTLSRHLHDDFDVPTYYIGSLLLELCEEEGLPPTYENRMLLGERSGLLNPQNPMLLLKHSYDHLRQRHPYPQLVLIDSIRAERELHFLQAKESGCELVALLLGRKTRHERLMRRDSSSHVAVEHRDELELGHLSLYNRHFEVGNLIGIANYYVLSEDIYHPQDFFHQQVRSMMNAITHTDGVGR